MPISIQNTPLSSVFGSFSQDAPDPTRIEQDAERDAQRASDTVFAQPLPEAPEVHPRTGLLTAPSMRIDGSSADPPWNIPEPILWDFLREVPIEFIEERCLDGSNGVFWARYRNYEGQLRSGLIRFDGVNREHVYETWGAEYLLDPRKRDILRRELAAYEVAKACGMEDMVAPVASREVNLVPLISGAVREKIASQLRISTISVDETFGTAALLHALPVSSDNFVEYWSTLGFDEASRWERASNRLRHSIYRAIALDFILGTADRILCSFLYNRTSDKLALYDLGVSFPNPALTAEKYTRHRKQGWGRRPVGSTEDPTDPSPAHGIDTFHLARLIQERYEQECVDTFAQVAQGFTQQMGILVGKILIEHGVPLVCVSGFLSRVAFLQVDPITVLRKPIDFVRNTLVPLRGGYGFGEGRNRHIVDYVSSTMTLILDKQFDFSKSLQEVVPPEVPLPI